jgi:hypothetical protein
LNLNAASSAKAGWRAWLADHRSLLMVVLLALALAMGARHGWVEPADLTARCDAAPWDSAVCAARSTVVQMFANQRLAWTALALAAIATLRRSHGTALMALALGCAGLVLYSADLSAPAVLLAALVLVRSPRSPRPAATPAVDPPADA